MLPCRGDDGVHSGGTPPPSPLAFGTSHLYHSEEKKKVLGHSLKFLDRLNAQRRPSRWVGGPPYQSLRRRHPVT